MPVTVLCLPIAGAEVQGDENDAVDMESDTDSNFSDDEGNAPPPKMTAIQCVPDCLCYACIEACQHGHGHDHCA